MQDSICDWHFSPGCHLQGRCADSFGHSWYALARVLSPLLHRKPQLLHCKLLLLLRMHGVGAYGSTKRYKSIQRLYKVNDSTVIGASGELSDFQYLQTLMEDLVTEDFCMDDGVQLQPKEIYNWLTRVLYNRRNKFASHPTLSCTTSSDSPFAYWLSCLQV